MQKQKKNFKTFFEKSVFSKGEFYIKFSIIFFIASIFIILFAWQNGRIFFEYYPYANAFKGNQFQVHVIDVENGDAILIKFPNQQTMMIDTGEEKYSENVLSYIQQYFWTEKVDKIDYLVLTHPDSDHIGGAKAILNKFKVVNLYRPKIYTKIEYENLSNLKNYKVSDSQNYDEVITTAYQKSCNMFFNEGGIKLSLGGVSVEFLAPLQENYSSDNNYSAVIKMIYQNKSFLFMGDATSSVENELVSKYGEEIDVDVLKVGHHGSNTSTSLNFLNKVTPDYAIISCNQSKYFPHQDVINNLNSKDCKILSTGLKGSFVVSVENDSVIFASAVKPFNYLALIFTILVIIAFIICKMPFKSQSFRNND